MGRNFWDSHCLDVAALLRVAACACQSASGGQLRVGKRQNLNNYNVQKKTPTFVFLRNTEKK